MSPGVYLKFTGKILVFGGAVSKEGLNGKMPRPFVVVHSGSTQMAESGFSLRRSASVTNFAPRGGVRTGNEKADKRAWKSDTR